VNRILTLTETVSFSLTIGTTPKESNSFKVFTALRYLVRWEKRVSSGMLLSARNDARLRYPRVSEALVRSVDPAGRTGYPRAQSIYPARSRPTPFRQSAAQKKKATFMDSLTGKCKKCWLTCFPERLFGRAGMDIRCRPTPMAPELTRTTLCPVARRRTTVSTMAESVDRSGWCVVSCTIDDVPASRRKQIYTVRGQSGQYTMLREPMGKELRIRTKFDYYDERFRADHSGNVVQRR